MREVLFCLKELQQHSQVLDLFSRLDSYGVTKDNVHLGLLVESLAGLGRYKDAATIAMDAYSKGMSFTSSSNGRLVRQLMVNHVEGRPDRSKKPFKSNIEMLDAIVRVVLLIDALPNTVDMYVMM